MPPKRREWTHPRDDAKVRMDLFISQDQKDPRALGLGPCKEEHRKPLSPRASQADFPMEFGANQYQRWAHCQRCGLKVGSWPKDGYTGKHNAQVNPTVVERALALMLARGESPSRKKMDALIKLVEAEEKYGSTGSRTAGTHLVPPVKTTPREGARRGASRGVSSTTRPERGSAARSSSRTAAPAPDRQRQRSPTTTNDPTGRVPEPTLPVTEDHFASASDLEVVQMAAEPAGRRQRVDRAAPRQPAQVVEQAVVTEVPDTDDEPSHTR